MNQLHRTAATAMAAMLLAFPAMHAQDDGYTFTRKSSPEHILPYQCTAIAVARHDVSTIKGDNYMSTKDTIAQASLSPTFVSYAVLTHKKKGKRDLQFMRVGERDFKISGFDQGRYGVPGAVVYTPDGRGVVVSTPNGLFVFDVSKFKLKDRFYALPFEPERMYMSPNGYYLLLVRGSQVVVYNFEDKTVRTTLDLEVPVTDVEFTADSGRMGILTDDGLLTIYDTRTMTMLSTVDELGDGRAFSFNDSGKYVAVATGDSTLSVINLLRLDERENFAEPRGGVTDMQLIKDALGNTLMMYTADKALRGRRLLNLEPYYAKLVSDKVDEQMTEWLKMRPGETMEEYQKRVNSDSTKAQRRLYEDALSTSLAGDMVSMSQMQLGSYNREKELLEVSLGNMPSIYLPVPQSDVTDFHSGDDLTVSDAQYGLLPDDSFELIYGKFTNRNGGKTYIYDNLDRVPMTFMDSDDNIVSLEVVQQQQMEELKLEELRQKVIAEARHDNIISEHTSISVDSRVVPDYDANGKRILNYIVKFTYQVDPDFSAVEDFAPGRYHIDESGAATSMLDIVKQAFEGDFAKYVKPGSKLRIDISGTADATPIRNGIAYDGIYGDFEDEPITQDGAMQAITVTRATGIRTNEQLAFLRAVGVKDFLDTRVNGISDMNTDYRYNIAVSEDKGSEFRRITAEFTFFDVF